MAIRIDFDGKQAGAKFAARVKAFSEQQIAATQAAARQAANEIERRGRANIRQAGNFGSKRWIEGFRAFVSFASRTAIRVRVTHAVFYWRVFQHGATIRGKPLLWIPLSFARAAQGVRARDFPGRLFRVDRRGKAPLLLTDGGRPMYFGKESVRIPKKFKLIEIAAQVSRRMSRFYSEAMRRGKRR